MKTRSATQLLSAAILSILFILSESSGRAQSPTPGVTDVSDLSAIKVQTPDRGVQVAGDIRDVLANYPTFAASTKTQLKARIDGLSDLEAAKLWKDLQTRGISLPAAAVTAITARIEALRAQKETALRNVATTNPARAKTALDDLLAHGVPITQATQDFVNAAQPTPAPTATPAPTPNDGL